MQIYKFFAAWLCLFLALQPLYLWQSGYPQIADLILAAMIPVFFFYHLAQVQWRLKPRDLLLGGFAGLTVIVNGIYFMMYGDRLFALSAMYYGYNALAFFMVLIIFGRVPNQMRLFILLALTVNMLLQLWQYVAGTGFDGQRFIGTYNNPNQLGYWSVLAASLVVVTHVRGAYFLVSAFLISCAGVFAALSLSKAAMLAYGLVALAYFIKALEGTRRLVAVCLIGGTVCGVALAYVAFAPSVGSVNAPPIVENAVARLTAIGQDKDDTLAARGYDRIVENPATLLVGAGEGGYERFPGDDWRAREIHSGFANILFSYGLFGFTLFAAFFILAVAGSSAAEWLIIAGILFYNLTHQGFRFTLFWVVLASIALQAARRDRC